MNVQSIELLSDTAVAAENSQNPAAQSTAGPIPSK